MQGCVSQNSRARVFCIAHLRCAHNLATFALRAYAMLQESVWMMMEASPLSTVMVCVICLISAKNHDH